GLNFPKDASLSRHCYSLNPLVRVQSTFHHDQGQPTARQSRMRRMVDVRSTARVLSQSQMSQRDYLSELKRRVLVFDGSMGANLQDLELTAEDFGGARYEGCMDVLCRTRPDAPARLHRGFLDADCDVIETNTFQASRLRLQEW